MKKKFTKIAFRGETDNPTDIPFNVSTVTSVNEKNPSAPVGREREREGVTKAIQFFTKCLTIFCRNRNKPDCQCKQNEHDK